jgi:Arc/MetJ-type ribon-helix-helix transcriptional regulator
LTLPDLITKYQRVILGERYLVPRTTATFTVSLPPEMAKELERVRKSEHRTRSELVREALRGYIREAEAERLRDRMAQLPEDEPTDDERGAIKEGRAEFKRGRRRTVKQVRDELLGPHRQSRAKRS